MSRNAVETRNPAAGFWPLEEADPMFTPSEVALWLRMSSAALAKMRARGAGPDFVTIETGVVRYRKSDLERWVSARLGALLPMSSAPDRGRRMAA